MVLGLCALYFWNNPVFNWIYHVKELLAIFKTYRLTEKQKIKIKKDTGLQCSPTCLSM